MNKLFSLLGLAQRAGKIVSGEEGVQSALRSKHAYCLLISEDSSKNTKQKFLNIAETNQVPTYIIGTMDRLGQAIGKARRATVLIQDPGFAQAIQEFLAEHNVYSGRKFRSDANEENKSL